MPINIASGLVELDREDFSLPGRVPITWVRSFRASLLKTTLSALGAGWTTSWSVSLARKSEHWLFMDRQAGVHEFHDPGLELLRGKKFQILGEFLEMKMNGDRIEVTKWDSDSGEIERYIFTLTPQSQELLLTSVENVSGDGVDLEWSNGRISQIKQRTEGRVILPRYSTQGQLVEILLSTSSGNVSLVRYEYDGTQLAATFDRSDRANRYEYDDSSNITREILKDGSVYSYEYDDQGRCTHFTGLDRYNSKSLKYLDASLTTLVTDSYGSTSVLQYNRAGQIHTETDPNGNERITTYDDFGRILSKKDFNGGIVSYSYDVNGNRNSLSDATGNVYRFEFNDKHQLTKTIEPNGAEWKREYNSESRLISSENPMQGVWRATYDKNGLPETVVNPLGNVRRFRYLQGLQAAVTDWTGNETRFEWDPFGRLLARTGPVGDRVTLTYDQSGNPIQILQPDGGVLQATYDGGGNLSSFTNAKREVTRFFHGSCGRLLERHDALGRVTRFHWGTEPERLESVVNEKGETFKFWHDRSGQVIRTRSFEGTEHQFTYDKSGRTSSFTNANGETITFKRDIKGRVVERILPDGSITSFTYNSLGRLISATSPHSETRFEYDAAGRLIQEHQGDEWVKSSYDLAGNVVATETSLGFCVDFELDPNARLKQLSIGKTQSITFERDPRGLETGRQLPSGVRFEQSYDLMGRLTHQVLGEVSTAFWQDQGNEQLPRIRTGFELIERTFNYDPEGQLLRRVDRAMGTTEYTYDLAKRLIGTTRSNGSSEHFIYDDTDNLISIVDSRQTIHEQSAEYAAGNRLVRLGSDEFLYDDEGRLVQKRELGKSVETVWTFHWDAVGQLVQLTRPDGQIWSYHYDAFGRRIAKVGPQKKTVYLWNGDNVIQEKYDSGSDVSWIMCRDSYAPLAKAIDGELYPIITDQIGTPCEMLDPRGRIVWSATYTSWGDVSSLKKNGEIDCPVRFQGQWFDEESGLHYNRFRYYDPKCARFISPDPIELNGGLNFYQYVKDPNGCIDPLGLAACHDSGDRGRDAAEADLKAAGHTILAEEVTMVVNGSRIRADFVTRDPAGNIHVVEVKNGSGRLTDNQTNAGVFNTPAANGSPSGGAGINTAGSTTATMTVATGNANKTTNVGLPARGGTTTATFSRLQYDV